MFLQDKEPGPLKFCIYTRTIKRPFIHLYGGLCCNIDALSKIVSPFVALLTLRPRSNEKVYTSRGFNVCFPKDLMCTSPLLLPLAPFFECRILYSKQHECRVLYMYIIHSMRNMWREERRGTPVAPSNIWILNELPRQFLSPVMRSILLHSILYTGSPMGPFTHGKRMHSS